MKREREDETRKWFAVWVASRTAIGLAAARARGNRFPPSWWLPEDAARAALRDYDRMRADRAAIQQNIANVWGQR